jgi:hypothetical protein
MESKRMSAIVLSGLLAGAVFFCPAHATAYPAYQCFKTLAGEYCSCKKFKSHQPAAKWIGKNLLAMGLQANDLIGRPKPSDTKSKPCLP